MRGVADMRVLRQPVPTALLAGRPMAGSGLLERLPGHTLTRAKENLGIRAAGVDVRSAGPTRPLLMVDIDGVLSLLAAPPIGGNPAIGPWTPDLEGRWHLVDGIPHYLSHRAATHLLALAPFFDLVWASGWEEKADEHLPHLLGLPPALPHLTFAAARDGCAASAHWKLDAIDAYAGERPLAWIDDALNRACEEWAAARAAPTLLVRTDPARGLTEREERILKSWAIAL